MATPVVDRVRGVLSRSGRSSWEGDEFVAAGAVPAGAQASAEQLAVRAALQVDIPGFAVGTLVDRLGCSGPGGCSDRWWRRCGVSLSVGGLLAGR